MIMMISGCSIFVNSIIFLQKKEDFFNNMIASFIAWELSNISIFFILFYFCCQKLFEYSAKIIMYVDLLIPADTNFHFGYSILLSVIGIFIGLIIKISKKG